MLKNERLYEKEDIKGMLKPEEISGDEMQGDFLQSVTTARPTVPHM